MYFIFMDRSKSFLQHFVCKSGLLSARRKHILKLCKSENTSPFCVFFPFKIEEINYSVLCAMY